MESASLIAVLVHGLVTRTHWYGHEAGCMKKQRVVVPSSVIWNSTITCQYAKDDCHECHVVSDGVISVEKKRGGLQDDFCYKSPLAIRQSSGGDIIATIRIWREIDLSLLLHACTSAATFFFLVLLFIN
jgi:hypothetical protein